MQVSYEFSSFLISETNNGFTCPEKAPTDEFGQFDPHPK